MERRVIAMKLQFVLARGLQVVAKGTESVGGPARLARKLRKRHGGNGLLHYRQVARNGAPLQGWQEWRMAPRG